MIPAIAIRPQPGCDATVAGLKARGLEAHGYPLFEIRPLPWETPAPETIDALLIGSANAIRHGGAGLPAFTGKPAYAVGSKTAEALQQAGFEVIVAGQGGLQDLLGQLRPEHRRLLRLCGQQRIEFFPPEGIEIVERVTYSSDALPMPSDLGARLREPALVLLHSAEAARHFAASCTTRAIDRSKLHLAAIGPRVAEAAGDGWAELRVAPAPNEEALLALAEEMCKEAPGALDTTTTDEMPTQDQTLSQTRTQPVLPPPAQPARRSGRGQLLVALFAFVLGSAVVFWMDWRGYLDNVIGRDAPAQLTSSGEEDAAGEQQELEVPANEAAAGAVSRNLKAVSSVEARIAMVENRLSRLNLQANAASGNAARAESLLIAFATRRMVDRGQPLRYLSDQLRLRFSNAQPRAVETIITFSEAPVTLDELSARLEALGPELIGEAEDQSFWDWASYELANIFTVRRERSAVLTPEARLERARVMLTAGRIPDAVDQVERLPGVDGARKWIADALRYEAAQKALDLIETAAMLEPKRLQDSEGNRIDQPSPIATPAQTEDAKATN